MNSDETSADTVIEAVTLVMGKHRRGSQEAWDEDRRLARDLHAAGLLADPADRDEPYDQLDNQRNLWAKQCHEAESRAERAEAELRDHRNALDFGTNCLSCARVLESASRETERAERAEAEVARLNGALTARSAALNARIDSAEKISKDVMAERDELRATVDRCREFLSEPVAVLSDGAVRDAYRMARAALDPEGGAS